MGDKKRKLSQNVREEEPVVEPEGKKVKQDKTAKKEEKKTKENTGKSQSRGGEEGVEVSVNGSGEKFEEKEDVEEKAEKKEKKDKEDKKVKKVKKNKTDKIEKKERKDKNEKKRKTDDVDENEGENDDGGVEVPAAHEESADAMDVDAQPTKDDEGKAQEKKEKKEKKKEKKAKKEKREPQEEQSQSQPEPAEASQAQEEPEQDSQKNARFIAFVGTTNPSPPPPPSLPPLPILTTNDNDIGNLPYSANTDSIKAHFTKNPPASIRVATEKDKPTKCRGFAFIEFENFDRMKTCLKLYHHSTFDDGKYPPRRINVELT